MLFWIKYLRRRFFLVFFIVITYKLSSQQVSIKFCEIPSSGSTLS